MSLLRVRRSPAVTYANLSPESMSLVEKPKSIRAHHVELESKPRTLRRRLVIISLCFSSVVMLLAAYRTYSLSYTTLMSAWHQDVSPVEEVAPTHGPSSVIGKLPVIDRSILHRLSGMDTFDPDEYDTFGLESVRTAIWPPLVTRIPENRAEGQLASTRIRMDSEVCPGGCRFLLPLRIGEQESKARLHLMQLAHFAHELDRVLILPNVGKSRMGLCFRWDFSSYYDVDHFLTSVDSVDCGLRVTPLERFKNWTSLRVTPPTARFVSLSPRAPSSDSLSLSVRTKHYPGFTLFVDDESDAADHKLTRCLTMRFPKLNLAMHGPVFIHAATTRDVNSYSGPSISLALSELDIAAWQDKTKNGPEANAHVPDVLVVDWDLRLPVFEQSSLDGIYLTYAPSLMKMASILLDQLGPSIAVHWRMETISPELLPNCAINLVNTLQDMLASYDTGNISAVWFASDYPYSISSASWSSDNSMMQPKTSKSGTFKSLSDEHHMAIAYVREAFKPSGSLERWTITDLSTELGKVRQHDFDIHLDLLDDPGVLGILDKAILSRAEIFISGEKNCGRISSFTKQVIDVRQRTFLLSDAAGRRLRNVVKKFG